ncbi:cytosolic protein [Bhargavaea beijingensis]|nr:cytosolic protein [Bhargavaea beijingensis]
MKMDVHYESQGYARISEGRVTKLDQPIAKGIDGVYENSSPPPKYIIAEAKYNSAQLQHTKHHRQMNNDWIDERLEDAIGKIKAEEVAYEKLMNPNNVQSKLIRIKANGEIIEKFLDNRGFIKGD